MDKEKHKNRWIIKTKRPNTKPSGELLVTIKTKKWPSREQNASWEGSDLLDKERKKAKNLKNMKKFEIKRNKRDHKTPKNLGQENPVRKFQRKEVCQTKNWRQNHEN